MLILFAIILVAFCSGVLGLIVLMKNRQSLANVSFGLFAILLGLWLIINYASNDISLGQSAVFWLNRITLFIPGIGLYFLFIFTLQFTGIAKSYFKRIAGSVGILSLCISILSATKYVASGIVAKSNLVDVRFGNLTPVFAIFILSIFIAIMTVFLISIHRLSGPARVRTEYMTASLFVALALTVITNLVLPIASHNFTYVVPGLFSSVILVGGFSYAIIKHRLFDIRTVVARGVAYVLLLATLSGLYALVAFKIGGFIFTHTKISVPQQAFNILTALILVFTFHPLQRFFQKITDKVFYRNPYDPQELINEIGQLLASEIKLIELSRRVREKLIHHMRVDHVNVIVLQNNKIFTESGHYVVSRLEDLAKDLDQIKSPLVVVDEEPENYKKEILQKYGISVFVILRNHKNKVGYLLFGNKLSGDIYTDVDLEVIDIISDQLAIAVQNAKSYVQIQQFNRTLRRKISEATKQLRAANVDLQQLDKVKDDFISITSHQLGTPLSVIYEYLTLIIDGSFGTFTEKQKKALSTILSRVYLTRGLVADLLNINRIAAGRFFISKEPTNVTKMVEEEVSQLKIKAKENNVRLTFVPPPKSIPVVQLDRHKTRQVIMNLIDNAINYSPHGHVNVEIESAGDQVIFVVTDNGIGVPESQQAKLYTKFFRAENAKSELPDGTGIGLYLVKKVIEDQGGSIIFSSQKGKGSRFGFRLPIVAVAK